MKPSSVCLLAPLLAAATCCATESMPGALSSRLKSIAGPGSRDCGTVLLHDSPDAAIACANDAGSSGKAYRLAIEYQGTDSVAWQAAARDEQGKLWVLYYDVDPSEGAQSAKTLSVVLCREIRFASRGKDVIECNPVLGEH